MSYKRWELFQKRFLKRLRLRQIRLVAGLTAETSPKAAHNHLWAVDKQTEVNSQLGRAIGPRAATHGLPRISNREQILWGQQHRVTRGYHSPVCKHFTVTKGLSKVVTFLKRTMLSLDTSNFEWTASSEVMAKGMSSMVSAAFPNAFASAELASCRQQTVL